MKASNLFLFVGCFLGSVLLACETAEVDTIKETPLIPTAQTSYTVTISGTTYYGNTNFPTNQTTYSPANYFQLRGTLHIAEGDFKNPRDIALVVGSPAGSPLAGSVWFASNTAMYKKAGIPSTHSALGGIDVGTMQVDEQNGSLVLEITNQNISRGFMLNIFNVKSGLLANAYQVLYGKVELTFSKNGKVGGQFVFYGNGFVEPGSTAIVAKIEGV